jgi:hypothetical protein
VAVLIVLANFLSARLLLRFDSLILCKPEMTYPLLIARVLIILASYYLR